MIKELTAENGQLKVKLDPLCDQIQLIPAPANNLNYSSTENDNTGKKGKWVNNVLPASTKEKTSTVPIDNDNSLVASQEGKVNNNWKMITSCKSVKKTEVTKQANNKRSLF